MGITLQLANMVGTPEPAIKLLLTVYSGYFFATIHRMFPVKQYTFFKLLYFTVTGVTMIYWNYGLNLYHSLSCIIVQYLIFVVLGGSVTSVTLSFIFQLGYLVYGYLVYSTTGYDINWTMPHCILTLRMIGLAFDVYDGHRDEGDLSPDQKERGIKDIPSLLEILGFSYLYCGFLVGPQFPLQRFRMMLQGELTDVPEEKPNSLLPGFRRGLSGTVMLLVQTALASVFYPMYYTTSEFQTSSFLYKASYIAVTGHITLLQYISIWIINEGTCIICGLGFRKDEKTGKVYWDTVRNVSLHKFLLARSFQGVIDSFNINTNGWVMRYVYKRLRFVGIKQVSQTGVLVFLAIWHGVHEGYFITFAYEFLTMNVEKPLVALLGSWQLVQTMKSNSKLKWIPEAVGFVYLHSLLGYCLINFSLLKWRLFQPVHMSVYYHGWVFYSVLFILLRIHSFFATRKKPEDKND